MYVKFWFGLIMTLLNWSPNKTTNWADVFTQTTGLNPPFALMLVVSNPRLDILIISGVGVYSPRA